MNTSRDRSPLPPTPPYGSPPTPGPVPSPSPARPAPAAVRAPTAKRRNPARGAKALALVSSVAATLGVAGALERGDGRAPATTAGPLATAAGGGTSSSASSSSASTSATRNASRYADGTYTGTAQPTKWGPIQVQVTIRSGRIVSVEEVVAPSDRKSQNINQQAAPILEQEAIAVQSADLDAVSGATWTSRTYTASLQAALDQARTANRATS